MGWEDRQVGKGDVEEEEEEDGGGNEMNRGVEERRSPGLGGRRGALI
jgi:hypothetical protein